MSLAPVIFILFNRPDVTRQTFSVIRSQRPSRLHLIADGPRASRPGEVERCRQTREIVQQLLDWPCEVTRDYADTNMGCGRRLSSGLTTAFDLLGEAIVLEDDILPHPDFFSFCTEMLARHRDNPRIHAINGFNPLGRYTPSRGACVPSVFNSVWGWASWRRAWRDYRFDMDPWSDPQIKQIIKDHLGSPLIHYHFSSSFDRMQQEQVDTWDYQWCLSMLQHRRLALVSSVNLIDNLGFTADATHTAQPEAYFDRLRRYPRVRTDRERDTQHRDPVFDALYARAIMTASQSKLSLIRLAARSELALRLIAPRLAGRAEH